MRRDGSPARRSSDLSRKSCAPWDFRLLSMSNIEQVDMIIIIMTSASTGGTCLSKATLVTARAVGMPKSTSITLSHVGSREFTVAASASQPSSHYSPGAGLSVERPEVEARVAAEETDDDKSGGVTPEEVRSAECGMRSAEFCSTRMQILQKLTKTCAEPQNTRNTPKHISS
jgi:hypothetical protein